VKAIFRVAAILVIVTPSAVGPSTAPACTGITIKPHDGSLIFARTLEFGMDLKSNILIVPRGKACVGTAPGDRPGLRWKTKYGIVGTNGRNCSIGSVPRTHGK
jgi:choloylglycine hydrolase